MAQKIKKRTSRRTITLVVAAMTIAFLVFSMSPRPVLVDTGAVEKSPMMMTIDEEGKTRVRDNYIVSAPIAGRLLRVEVDAGDAVEGQATIVARILPSNPSFLDARAKTEAESAVRSAEAAIAMANADVARLEAEYDYARAEAARMRALRKEGAVAAVALERAELALKSATAQRQTAKAAVQARQAELENARAHLITPSESGDDNNASTLSLTAPITGDVLRVIQESETIVSAGAPILEVGDLNSDLEIVSEYLSSDAVLISEGDRVIIEKWGDNPLVGRVRRVEPYGFTKLSALGVEEQRVNVIIDFISPRSERKGLGHGFRVETRTVIWESPDALNAPSAALFRQGGDWAAFVNEGGRARLRKVAVGRNNGIQAEILDGLNAGDVVVLYPGTDLNDGDRIKKRNAED